jgi:Mg2+-importing ATPase
MGAATAAEALNGGGAPPRGQTRSSNVAAAPAATGAWWAGDTRRVLDELGSSTGGLSSAQAAERLVTHGRNELQGDGYLTRPRLLWKQLESPLLLLLLVAAGISAATGEWRDAILVGAIVLVTVAVGYARESRAQTAVAALRRRVQTLVTVIRDGASVSLPLEEVVPGDVVRLCAGSIVPGDGLVLEATECHVTEGVLTGESFPVRKSPGVVPVAAPLSGRSNCVFLGTSVRSGMALCVLVATGGTTELGKIAHRLSLARPETEFDKGVRRFGYLLTVAMLALVLLVFFAHMMRGRPAVETLLFAIALAVGLSPELLPVILTVNLARGAETMARQGVLVRRLNAIEDLGSMDVLCTDKTGTLTEGVARFEHAHDAGGADSSTVLTLAALNAGLQTGLRSPMDDAILEAHAPDLGAVRKLAEVPFDFVRKRVSVIVERGGAVQLIAKGAFLPLLEACTRWSDGSLLDAERRRSLVTRYEASSREGQRVLAVAVRALPAAATHTRAAEEELTFAGYLTFADRPKDGAREAIASLARLGVSVKMVTGDSRWVAEHVAREVGLPPGDMLTGADIQRLHDTALCAAAQRAGVFAEVDPAQKERVLLALKRAGRVVGFLGDGVNDAPAMHAADTSLSVQSAVDVAREAADFVLLDRDLDVIRRGIEEGRKTFANTMKYVLTTLSANLGNMLSMAVASLFLPFLPLLAAQILINNFLSDIPAFALAADHVDPEQVSTPRRWDIRFIGRFMLEFGALSSAFDLITFGALLWVFQAVPEVFRTAWFVESLLTELVIALVVRTNRPIFRSRPARGLLVSTVAMIPLTMAIPYLPHAGIVGFVPIPAAIVGLLVAITCLYMLAAELLKASFYRRASMRPA